MQFGNECSVATLFVPVPLPSLSFCLFLILPFSAETLPKKKICKTTDSLLTFDLSEIRLLGLTVVFASQVLNPCDLIL